MQLLHTFFIKQYLNFLPNAEARTFQESFPNLDSIFAIQSEIISKSNQSEIFSIDINQQKYYVKRYFTTKGVASWFGFSRFRTETKNQLWFNQSGLPSAVVIAYGEERIFLKTKRAVLITKAISNTKDLAYIAKHTPEAFRCPIWRKQLIKQSASILQYFHRQRFCHNDLHWRNILVQSSTDTNIIQLHLIDCPSGKKLTWPLFNYKKFKDLANIDKRAPQHLSKTQRLRFFMAYQQIDTLSAKDKRSIKEILKHKANRIKRKSKEQ